MSMKAVKWFGSRGTLEFVDVPAPSQPKPGHVILKIAFAGTCGTDISFRSKNWPLQGDVILGHEFSGTVTALGENVTAFKVGDRVTATPLTGCDTQCRMCSRGRPNLCTADGGLLSFLGICRDGGFAEYCEVPAGQLIVLPEGMTLMQAVMSDPVSCILHGYRQNGYLPIDARILVIGAGTAGLIWSGLYHYHGYRDITITNRSQKRRTVASGLGLGYKVFHPDEIAKSFTDGSEEENGFDLIVDAAGNADAVEQAFTWLRAGGKLNVYGYHPVGSTIKFDLNSILLKELSIIGSVMQPYTFTDAVQLVHNMAETYFDFDQLGIKVYRLNEYQEAMDAMERREILKAVFNVGA